MSPSYVNTYTVALINIGLLFTGCHCSLPGTVEDVANSAHDVVKGNVQNAVKTIPKPDDFFQSSVNVVLGYPLEVVITTINQLCNAALSESTIKPRVTPDINRMSFQFRKGCNKYNYSILHPDKIWNNPEFDKNKKVIIFATGWRNTINKSGSLHAVYKAYNCRDNVNFVAVDAADYVDTLYTWSAFNTEAIGSYISEGLVSLSKVVPIENIHLIGHSLGAHIMGAAARDFSYKTGKLIPRITALDPARPCFNEGLTLSGLMRGDAKFIDVIHSNPGVLGKRDVTGDVDFYPGGLDPLPKGCYDVACAHRRSWEYYAETIYPGNENSFMGIRCSSLTNLQQGKCKGQAYPMGYAVPTNLKGSYFLEVNGKSPYGKESNAELLKSKENCGVCPEANGN